MTKTERQTLGIKRWIKAGGTATWAWATGTGKTYAAVMLIQQIIKHNINADVLIVVPTQVLKEQWMNDYLIPFNLLKNCRIGVLKSTSQEETSCDLLIVDECHTVPTENYQNLFFNVTYKMILCLTATLERLDGKEELIKKYAPVCDTITPEEAEANNWTNPVKQYCVLLDVDLTEYQKWNQIFIGSFATFDYNFDVAMKCATDINYRNKFAKLMGVSSKEIAAKAAQWMNSLKKRKAFILDHPKKLEVAKKIIEARKDKKIITFSATIKMSEQFGSGFVLHSKKSKKDNTKVLETFNSATSGVLHTSKAADAGIDVKGLSVGIILATDSSKIRAQQRRGRISRFEPGKKSELFTLVLRDTQDQTWFNNSATGEIIAINESQLNDVLAGKSINVRPYKRIENKKYRF